MAELYDNPFSRRLLSTFILSDEIQTKLKSKGFTLKSEIQYLSDSKLKEICDLNDTQIDAINKEVKNSHKRVLNIRSVKELCDSAYTPIHTGSYSLDKRIDGGIHVSKITQISSEAGAGKTQLCMQVCVNVQLPPQYGGLSGQALYIDTEDNLRPERIRSMAIHRLSEHPDLMTSLSPQIIESRIHVFKSTTNSEDFINLVLNRIEPFIDQNPKIRLLVIDSIAQHFRYDYRGTDAQKDYELSLIAQKLRQIAHSKKLAVLISNQFAFSTRLKKNVPTLGKHWQTVCNIGIVFSKFICLEQTDLRNGQIVRSSQTASDNSFWFKITENGIEEAVSGQDNSSNEELMKYKRNGIVVRNH